MSAYPETPCISVIGNWRWYMYMIWWYMISGHATYMAISIIVHWSVIHKNFRNTKAQSFVSNSEYTVVHVYTKSLHNIWDLINYVDNNKTSFNGFQPIKRPFAIYIHIQLIFNWTSILYRYTEIEKCLLTSQRRVFASNFSLYMF